MPARYRRLSVIGEGGQGKVYRARRIEDGMVVALKYLAEDADEDQAKRFVREVRLQANLDHPNILPILGSRLKRRPLFFAMPLADANLRDRLTHLRSNAELAFAYFEQVLSAVEHAHSNGVVHRDLKPENILILSGPEGDYPAVGDFGLGKELERQTPTLTGSWAVMGTLGYAAPEQLGEARDVDERCDIYALGVILYELLTGRGLSVSVRLGELPNGLGYVVEKCVQQNPEDRYQTIAELRRDFAMFTTQTDLLDAPEQTVKRIVESLAGQRAIDRDRLWELSRVFCDNLDDEMLLTRAFPRLPDNVLDAFAEQFPGDLLRILKAYDDAVSGGLPFEYCDVVARFYRKLYGKFDEASTRKLILSRLLVMGVSHNRFFVLNLVVDMLCNITDRAEAGAARDVLKAHPEECHQLKDQLLSGLRLPLLRQAVKDATA